MEWIFVQEGQSEIQHRQLEMLGFRMQRETGDSVRLCSGLSTTCGKS